MAGVHENFQELVQAVSKETGVKADVIRKVLAASFESTKAYIIRELKQGDVAGQSLLQPDDSGQVFVKVNGGGMIDS